MADQAIAESDVYVEGGMGSDGDRNVAGSELFHWLYRFFYSKTVGLVLILAMAAYAVIGSVVAQAGPNVYSDPAQKESFLESVRENYGAWTGVLDALGLFHVFTSVGFYVVVAMLALSIIACTSHRIPELWRRWFHPRVHVSPKFFEKARYRGFVATDSASADSLESARAVLKQNRFRILPDDRDPENAIYADRNAWSGIGTVVAHISFIIILLAFVISSRWGISEDLAVPVGGEVAVGHDTGLTVYAKSFTDSYTEEGQAADYVSELELRRDGETVAEQTVRVNNPLEYEGFRYHQQSFGVAADVTVNDGETTVFEESVPMKWTSEEGANAVGMFELDEYEIVVVTAASGRADSSIAPGTALVELYPADTETGEPLQTRLARQGESVELGGLNVTFERERQYTGIQLRHDPGAPLMWVGFTLLVLGMSATFMFPYRRLWVRVDNQRIRFGAVSRLDTSYQRLFEKIIQEVAEHENAETGVVIESEKLDPSEEADGQPEEENHGQGA
ncbi:cytochrome c biogenesis protein ResB [Ancrocorticia populi]|uniref:cytochrome c biogenesis protein ResB n=1 Tax=Ancrocorticia populi TaxID=2175228 RepID=UPI003F90EB34